MFQVGLDDGSVFCHNNNTLLANHSEGWPIGLSYGSSVWSSNGPLPLYQGSSITMAKININSVYSLK